MDLSVFWTDKIVINLLSLILTVGGILSVLIRYSVPELNQSFIGSNPHGRRRDKIDGITNCVFVSVSMFGVALQGYAIIYDQILLRTLSGRVYVAGFLFGIVVMGVFTAGVAKVANMIVERVAMPSSE